MLNGSTSTFFEEDNMASVEHIFATNGFFLPSFKIFPISLKILFGSYNYLRDSPFSL